MKSEQIKQQILAIRKNMNAENYRQTLEKLGQTDDLNWAYQAATGMLGNFDHKPELLGHAAEMMTSAFNTETADEAAVIYRQKRDLEKSFAVAVENEIAEKLENGKSNELFEPALRYAMHYLIGADDAIARVANLDEKKRNDWFFGFYYAPETQNPAAALGSRTSEKKRKSSAENGKKGGRPAKKENT